MARKATGQLIWRKSGWYARFWTVVDGVEIRVCRPLGTENKAVARRKLAKLLADRNLPSAEQTKAVETVDAFAEPWLKDREARAIRSAEYERKYYERIWRPAFGQKAMGAVTAAEVRAVLHDLAAGRILSMRDKQYSRQSISHIRAAAFRLFQAAWRDEVIPENRVARVEMPEMEEEKKPRAVLTDAELGTLLAHPEVDAEVKMLVLLSRTIGGMRAGDLNALDWSAFGPEFATCTFTRRKTKKKKPAKVGLEVPLDVRPFIAAWWKIQGSPVVGPVFPVRRGPRAGQSKKASNMSYAERLRKELIRAGVTRHELHVETETTLPVDFHSTRRAYSQALAHAGTNEQTAMALTGHSDSKVHQRYLESVTVRAMPERAVPALRPDWASLLPKLSRKDRLTIERDTRFELATPSLGRDQESGTGRNPAAPASARHPLRAITGEGCPFPLPFEMASLITAGIPDEWA